MIYSSNRKQFIFVKIVKCGVPLGSILGPLFFLIFVNKLNSSTKVLDPVLFADDTNLFCSGNNIGALFETANQELSQIHKLTDQENIPLKLSSLQLNGKIIE